jgi:hypothetical protein
MPAPIIDPTTRFVFPIIPPYGVTEAESASMRSLLVELQVTFVLDANFANGGRQNRHGR